METVITEIANALTTGVILFFVCYVFFGILRMLWRR